MCPFSYNVGRPTLTCHGRRRPTVWSTRQQHDCHVASGKFLSQRVSSKKKQTKKRRKKEEREIKTKYDRDKGVRDIRRSKTGMGLTVYRRPPSTLHSPITLGDSWTTPYAMLGDSSTTPYAVLGDSSTTPRPQFEDYFSRLHVKFDSHIV
jgi:hypothetical protein